MNLGSMRRMFVARYTPIFAVLALTSVAGCGSSNQGSTTKSSLRTSSDPAGTFAASSKLPPPVRASAPRSGVTDDQMAVSMMAKAMGRVGIGCESEVSYQGGAIEPFWSVGGKSVAIIECLGSSKGYGAEFSYSPNGQRPVTPSDVSSSSGGYLLIGSNFVIEFGGEDPTEACIIKRAIPVEAKVISTGSPKANC
jgi:hypothetical protein